jgi:capreomycidine synthase
MGLQPALLEQWMRDYYFETDFDLGSSGVRSFSLAQIRELTGLGPGDLDDVVFDDSWTLGGPGVRAAVADRFAGGDTSRVMITHGSSEAIYLTMTALLRPHDEVIVVDPAYQQLHGIAEATGCRVRRWPLDPAHGFEPDLDALSAMVGPATRMVVANFPHNPTGASISAGQQRRLVDIVARSGAYLVWDAAFAEITHGGPPLPDPGGWYDRAISYGTLSKCYGLPGLRVGWCIAAPEVLEKCVLVRDYVSLHLSPLVELVAARVITAGDRIVEIHRELATANLAVLDDWMKEHSGHVEWARPRGGVCTFVKFTQIRDVEAFCHRLARQDRILLVPGSCFGYPQYARLGFGSAAREFETGLATLGRHLEAAASPVGSAAADRRVMR